MHYAFIAKCAILSVNIAFHTSRVVTYESIFTTTRRYYYYIVRVHDLFILQLPYSSILIEINSIKLPIKNNNNKSRTSPTHLFGVFKLTYKIRFENKR